MANKGWEFVELSDTEQAAAEETLAIRGYRLHKHETRTIHVKAGEHLIYENDLHKAAAVPPARDAPRALLGADVGATRFRAGAACRGEAKAEQAVSGGHDGRNRR